MSWLRRNRERIDRELASSPARQDVSAILYGQYRGILPLIKAHASGRLLDVGAGNAPFKGMLPPSVTLYHALDVKPLATSTYVGDAQAMTMIEDAGYDTVLCVEVLEHLSDPFQAVREINRVLKPGGALIFSVPHLSRLHDEPHDYYRYTKYGLRYLFEGRGFRLVELQPRGGLFSFLAHQFSIGVLSLVWPVPVLRQIVWTLNKLLLVRLPHALDHMTDRKKLFAVGYVGVARKVGADALETPRPA